MMYSVRIFFQFIIYWSAYHSVLYRQLLTLAVLLLLLLLLFAGWDWVPRYLLKSQGSEGRDIDQAVSRWLPTAAVRGSKPGLGMWDLWWDKVALGRFSPSTSVSPAVVRSTNYSTITLMYHPGKMYNRPMWPQCWDLYEPHQIKKNQTMYVYGKTSQKAATFMVVTMWTWNPTFTLRYDGFPPTVCEVVARPG
jgi:hypothetical protein